MNAPRLFLMIALACAMGCSTAPDRKGPYSGGAAPAVRDAELSRQLYEESRAHLTDDPRRAEELLRQALDADLYHGAAHNNLGVLLLQRGLLYESIQEFEWARKLMPGHPDPRVNLAIALYSAGQSTEALAAAQTALEVEPENLPAIQAVAFMQIRTGRETDETLRSLALIRQRSADAEWRDWAEAQQLRLESRTTRPGSM